MCKSLGQAHGRNMDDLGVIMIDTVQPGNHPMLDQKEEDSSHRLRITDYMTQGGMNIKDNLKRNTRATYRCKFCKS